MAKDEEVRILRDPSESCRDEKYFKESILGGVNGQLDTAEGIELKVLL